jgi:hypothetical protein
MGDIAALALTRDAHKRVERGYEQQLHVDVRSKTEQPAAAWSWGAEQSQPQDLGGDHSPWPAHEAPTDAGTFVDKAHSAAIRRKTSFYRSDSPI